MDIGFLLIGLFFIGLALWRLRSGELSRGGGRPPYTREDDPVMFWLAFVILVGVGGAALLKSFEVI